LTRTLISFASPRCVAGHKKTHWYFRTRVSFRSGRSHFFRSASSAFLYLKRLHDFGRVAAAAFGFERKTKEAASLKL